MGINIREYFKADNAEINVGRGKALFLWVVHLCLAEFLYLRGAEYKLAAYYLAAGLVVVASIPYLRSAINDRFIPYEGIYIFMTGHLIGFTAYIFLPLEKIELNHASWTYAMKMAFYGAAVFLMGYWSIFGRAISRTLPVKRFIVDRVILVKLPLKFYIIGWVLRLLPGFCNSTLNIFNKIEIIGIPMKILKAIQGWEISGMFTNYGICAALMIDMYLYLSTSRDEIAAGSKRKILLRLSFFLIIETIYNLSSMMAGAVIRPLIFMFLSYIRTRRKLPVIPIAIVLFFFIFFAVPFIKTFRSIYPYSGDLKASITSTTDILVDEKNRSTRRDMTIKRLSNPLEMAAVCYEAKLRGKEIVTYKDLPEYISRFVPRAIWPQKPSVDYNEIGREIGMLGPEDYGTAISLTLIGGLVIDNGIYGVIIGMFLAGIMLRVLWEWFIVRSGGNFIAFVVYIVLVYHWVFPDDFYAILHSSIVFIVYAYFLLGFVNRGYYIRR